MPSTPPFWSRPRTSILLGAAACAACCAAPIAAVVVGAGAATTLAAFLEPVAGIMIGLAAVVAIAAYLRHRRRAAVSCATTGACAVDRSCGCSPTAMRDQARSVGCTLPEHEMPGRVDEFSRLFARGLVRRERDETRAIWTFAWSPDLERDARALARAEQGCCSFWQFDIDQHGAELRWSATAPPAQRAAIAMIDDLARASMARSTSA